MKKLFALLLAVLMLLSVLAGCHRDPEFETEPSQTLSGIVHMPESNKTLPNRTVTLGTLQHGIYANEYTGYRCDLRSKWNVYFADQLQPLPEDVDKVLNDSKDTTLSQLQVLRADTTARQSIRINYELVNDYDRRRFASMEEAEIIDLLLEQKFILEQIYAKDGVTVSSIEKKTVTFMGKERTAVFVTGKYQGHDHYIVELYDYQLGRYCAITTLSTTLQDTTDDLLAMFQPVD